MNGKNADKIFKYCRANSELYKPVKNTAKEIPWNFTKFVIDATGSNVKFMDPRTLAETAEKDIRAILEDCQVVIE